MNFIIEYQSEHTIAPSVREIATHLGLRSPSGIHRVLNILREKGYIKAEAARKRAWRYCGRLPGKGMPLLGSIAAGDPIEAIELSKLESTSHRTCSARETILHCGCAGTP